MSRLVFTTPYSYKQEPLSTALYAVPAGALLTLLAISMVALWRLRRAIPVELLPLAVLGLAAFAIHVPIAANPRFSLPVVPLAICFVSVMLLRNVGFRGAPAREAVGFVRV